MKLNKKIAVAAAVGALGMAAVPAMALENEFSGIYNLGFFMSNYDNAGTAALSPKAMYNTNKTGNYFEQRARIKYTAKASDDLKLVTHFEINSTFGGSGALKTSVSTNSTGSNSGQLDADSINLQTKNVYLDFNVGKNVNVKAGIQTVSDKFKGILYSVTDMAGVNVTTKMGALDLNTAYFRVGTKPLGVGTATYNNNNTEGWNNFDIAVLDAQYNINKNAKVGAAYYLISDNTSTGAAPTATQVMVNTFGAYGSAKVGAATLSGFVAAQYGHETASTALRSSKSGYAANMAARVPVGPGTLKANYLFRSGDDNRDRVDTSWYSLQHTGNNTATGSTVGSLSQYNEAGMMILVRNLTTNATNSGRFLAQNVGDINGVGGHIMSVGYDATITPKAFASVNAGMLFAHHNQSTTAAGTYSTNKGNGTNLMATEINTEIGYKLYPNMTASVQAAYAFLGGYYNGCNSATAGKNAENPYTGRIMLKYAF